MAQIHFLCGLCGYVMIRLKKPFQRDLLNIGFKKSLMCLCAMSVFKLPFIEQYYPEQRH